MHGRVGAAADLSATCAEGVAVTVGDVRLEPRLTCTRLVALFQDVQRLHRLYELMSLKTDEHLREYVDVVWAGDTGGLVLQATRETAPSEDVAGSGASAHLPLWQFNQWLHSSCERTTFAADVWGRSGVEVPDGFLSDMRTAVERVKQDLSRSDDPLVRHRLASIADGSCPLCRRDRADAVRCEKEYVPHDSGHAQGFHAKAAEMLTRPEVTSVRYFGWGDHRLYLAMARERCRRSVSGQSGDDDVLAVAFKCQHLPSRLDRHDLGAAPVDWSVADLLIYGGDHRGGAPAPKGLVEDQDNGPTRYMLTPRDAGEISGFDRMLGDGWVLYERSEPRLNYRALRERHRGDECSAR